MDNASVYGTEDCRFDSCRGRDVLHDQIPNHAAAHEWEVTSQNPIVRPFE
ncbi:unnamed protein product [Toxocara canis]|uniref:DUF3499 family protein n=1 Tax=Toxocara canis TaxID=6265 RepID=A0A183VHB9_TOXCA|nr:unnamed protein product [Toxocara canis]